MSTRKRTPRKLTEAEAWRRLAHEFGAGRMGRSMTGERSLPRRRRSNAVSLHDHSIS